MKIRISKEVHSVQAVMRKFRDMLNDPNNLACHRNCCHVGSLQYVLQHQNDSLQILLLGENGNVLHSIVTDLSFQLKYDWWKANSKEWISWNPSTKEYKFIHDTTVKKPSVHTFTIQKRFGLH